LGYFLRNWVKVFCTDIESAVLNNGYATNWIKPSTGVRQGCPLSPYLFILATELMSMKIRQSSVVKGISIFERELKLENVPSFYKDILLFFHELKALHGCHHEI